MKKRTTGYFAFILILTSMTSALSVAAYILFGNLVVSVVWLSLFGVGIGLLALSSISPPKARGEK